MLPTTPDVTAVLVRLPRILLGRDLPVFPEVAVESVVLGTRYGAHCISLRGLGKESVVYSFGVGEDVSFDLEVIERIGATVYAFDPTPRSLEWVRGQRLPAAFVMHDIGLSTRDGAARFWVPEDPSYVSHTLLGQIRETRAIEVQVKRLSTVMQQLGHSRLDVLKMDIEGAEYDAIDDLLASTIEVDQILVEFHHHLLNVPLSRTRRTIQALRRAGYRVFHISSSGHEYSFIHERRLSRS